MAHMPHLVQMDKDLRSKGLAIVGAEVQGTPESGIKAFAKEHKIEFPLVQGTTRPATLSGIPHVAIFNPAGELVFAGHPGDPRAEEAIENGLKEVTDATLASIAGGDGGPLTPKQLVAEREWTNTDGQKMRAAVVELKGDTVTFRIHDGRHIPYDLNKLSSADQEAIRSAAGK